MSQMNERNRPRPEATVAPPSGGGNDPAGTLEALRRAGQDLLAAGDAAISRALETDAETFLRASRQQSGQ